MIDLEQQLAKGFAERRVRRWRVVLDFRFDARFTSGGGQFTARDTTVDTAQGGLEIGQRPQQRGVPESAVFDLCLKIVGPRFGSGGGIGRLEPQLAVAIELTNMRSLFGAIRGDAIYAAGNRDALGFDSEKHIAGIASPGPGDTHGP